VTLPTTVMTMLSEANRTRLINELACVLREQCVPPETRAAGLTLIGWLARRMPDDFATPTPCPAGGPAVITGCARSSARRPGSR
jgi:hypothetical protein